MSQAVLNAAAIYYNLVVVGHVYIGGVDGGN